MPIFKSCLNSLGLRDRRVMLVLVTHAGSRNPFVCVPAQNGNLLLVSGSHGLVTRWSFPLEQSYGQDCPLSSEARQSENIFQG